MNNINVTPKFVLAGNATFTVSNGEGKHYTYHVYASAPSAEFPNPIHFIQVLTAPERFEYMGRLIVPHSVNGRPTIKRTQKSHFGPGAPSWRTLEWALRAIWQVEAGTYKLPERMSIKHDGRCGRCGAKLTHPASLDTGLGPECADKAGVQWAEHSHYTGPTLLDVPVEDMVDHPGHPSNHG